MALSTRSDGSPTGRVRYQLKRFGPVMWITGGIVGSQALAGLGGIFVARALGPTGKGVVTGVTTWGQMVGILALLGMSTSAGLRVAGRGIDALRLTLGNALVYTATAGAAAVGIGLLIVPRLLDGLGPGASELAAWSLLLAPGALMGDILLSVLVAKHRTRQNSVAQVVGAAVAAGASLVLWRTGLLTTGWAVFANIAGVYATLIVCGVGMPWLRATFDRAALFEDLRFGLKVHPFTVMQLANLRLDLLLMSVVLAASEVGLYGVANTIMLAVIAIPTAGSWLLAPAVVRVERTPDVTDPVREQLMLTRRTAWRYLVLAVAAGVVLFLLAPWIIVFLFGSKFRPAGHLARILIPGYVARSYGLVATSGATGMRRPWVGNASQGVAIVVTGVMLPFLLPSYGAEGAAITSTCAYSVAALVAAYAVYVAVPRRRASAEADNAATGSG